jgi:thioredoxin reductase
MEVLSSSIMNGWTADQKAPLQTLICDKLILATCITAQSLKPDSDLSFFDGFSFHSVQMGRRHNKLIRDSVKHVAIVGGHKSAIEVAGTCAQAGKKVKWLIREDGCVPPWMMLAKKPDGSSMDPRWPKFPLFVHQA